MSDLIERLHKLYAIHGYESVQEAADALEAKDKDINGLMTLLAKDRKRIEELETNRPTPDNNKILSEDLPTAIKEYLRVCGPDLKWNAYHLLSEAAAALKGDNHDE